ncbi:MAG: hypothetical protein J6A53_01955 [Clostridia bacterium]|nr:hypothetical protein [Clostridia bacterium]
MCIKKLLIALTLMFTLIIFSSCDGAQNSTSDQNTTSDDLIEDTNTDTNTDTNIDTNQATDSEIVSDSNDIQTDLETDTDIITDTESKDTFGNFTTLHKTIASADRMKQMKYSSGVFGTGSKYTPDQLKSTRLQAGIIASAKFMFPNASEFMEHYLEGEGKIYELDIEDFLENKIAQENMYKDVNDALRSAENMAVKGEKVTIYQIEESIHHNLTGDWKYSVGSYFTSVELYDIEQTTWFGVTYYTAKLKYVVQDFYNWDANDTNDISITKVSPADLHQLHVNGEAQEFLTYGEEEYKIKWVKGVDASTIRFENE